MPRLEGWPKINVHAPKIKKGSPSIKCHLDIPIRYSHLGLYYDVLHPSIINPSACQKNQMRLTCAVAIFNCK